MLPMTIDIKTVITFVYAAKDRGELSDTQCDEILLTMGSVIKDAMSLDELKGNSKSHQAVDRHALNCGLKALQKASPTLWKELIEIDNPGKSWER